VRPRAKVIIGSLSCIWEIDWYKMNNLDLCLEVVSRSCQPLRYIRRWISGKPLQIEAWFQRTTNRKMPYGVSRDRWCHVTPKGAVISTAGQSIATAWLLVNISITATQRSSTLSSSYEDPFQGYSNNIWWTNISHTRQQADSTTDILQYTTVYTVFRKKQPLTFSFISPWVMRRF